MAFVSYAQNFEDVLLWRALQHVEKGFYIDVGAASPVEGSVTRAFYDHGWSGINVEPEPSYAAQLRESRPRDTNVEAAVGTKAGRAAFFRIPGTGLSTLDSEIAEGHRNAGYSDLQSIDVKVTTVADLWRAQGSPTVHFLKVDAEGSERDVISGAELGAMRPWLIVIEATKPSSPEIVREDFEDLILRDRYSRCWFDGLNDWYVSDETKEALAGAFETPPNCFDDFVLASHVAQMMHSESLQASLDKTYAAHLKAEARITELEEALLETHQRLESGFAAQTSAQGRITELEEALLETHQRLESGFAAQTSAQGRITELEEALLETHQRLESGFAAQTSAHARITELEEALLETHQRLESSFAAQTSAHARVTELEEALLETQQRLESTFAAYASAQSRNAELETTISGKTSLE